MLILPSITKRPSYPERSVYQIMVVLKNQPTNSIPPDACWRMVQMFLTVGLAIQLLGTNWLLQEGASYSDSGQYATAITR